MPIIVCPLVSLISCVVLMASSLGRPQRFRTGLTQAVDKSACFDRQGKQTMMNEQLSRRTMPLRNGTGPVRNGKL